MKKQMMITFFSGLLILSCKNKPASAYETGDIELRIQASRIKSENDDPGQVNYKLRLIPASNLMQNADKEKKTALMYRMDSCFYIDGNHQKVYAALVQPVANGVAGTYEYLLEFETRDTKPGDSLRLTYQDKYINHKIYHITTN